MHVTPSLVLVEGDSDAIPIATHESPDFFGFFACVADLKDELIRAVGAEAVHRVPQAQAGLNAFRRVSCRYHSCVVFGRAATMACPAADSNGKSENAT